MRINVVTAGAPHSCRDAACRRPLSLAELALFGNFAGPASRGLLRRGQIGRDIHRHGRGNRFAVTDSLETLEFVERPVERPFNVRLVPLEFAHHVGRLKLPQNRLAQRDAVQVVFR